MLGLKIESRSQQVTIRNQRVGLKVEAPERICPFCVIMPQASKPTPKEATRIGVRMAEIPGRKSMAGMNV